MKKSKKIWHIVAFIAVFAAAIGIVMLLWNALIPSVIGWQAINYWQAAGLIILCKLLFGGFGRHSLHGFPFHRRRDHIELHETMRNMSHDERRDFIRQRMSQGCDSFRDRHQSPNIPEA